MPHTVTPELQAIHDEIVNGEGHLLIRARAGTGKTTAILSSIDLLAKHHPRKEITVCAYNKPIADEIKQKLITAGHTDFRKVSAATIHSLGFGLVRFAYKPNVDYQKVRKIIKEMTGTNGSATIRYGVTDERQDFIKEHMFQIEKLVGVAKQSGVGFFDDMPIKDNHVWYELMDRYDINGFDDTTQMDDLMEVAQQVYIKSLAQTDVVDFDDMILFPLIKNMTVKFQKDILFVDEAQDLSRARQALARKFVKPDGRIILVGDDWQAIYAFSGADSRALDHLTEQLDAKVLPLSVTWRCPASVVELAQTLVPDIRAADGAQRGNVDVLPSLTRLIGQVRLGPESSILCRNTAPLIDAAYALIRQGVACKVEGKAIGEDLKVLLTRWKVKTLEQFTKKLDVYREREMQKALAKERESRMQQIADKCDTLMVIVQECQRQAKHMVSDAVDFVDNLFADGIDNILTLASYHRSKGREWDRVILLEHGKYCPSKYARKPDQKEQESHLAYVAYTRAKQELLFFDKETEEIENEENKKVSAC